MMNSSDGGGDPSPQSGDESGLLSGGSQHSSGRSLLERIQMQREREQAAAQQQQTPQQIQVPSTISHMVKHTVG